MSSTSGGGSSSNTGGNTGDSGTTGNSETGKTGKNGNTGRNEPNQPRQPSDDQVITGGNQGAMGQGERFGRPGDVIRSDRYKPENNPERNPEPVTGDEDREANKSTTTGSTSKNSQQEKRDWE
jgi:hypothetical protein